MISHQPKLNLEIIYNLRWLRDNNNNRDNEKAGHQPLLSPNDGFAVVWPIGKFFPISFLLFQY